jgi:hypothetical protein
MASKGLSLIACLTLAACSQPGGNTAQDEPDDDVMPATESYKTFGDYVVHFNAVPTTDLPESIAGDYGIIRSNNRILLNVSMLQAEPEGLGTTPVAGIVEASAANLTGQLRNLLTREEREDQAIYYLAETQVVNGETLIFTIDATPEGMTEPFRVRFQKQFFIDE